MALDAALRSDGIQCLVERYARLDHVGYLVNCSGEDSDAGVLLSAIDGADSVAYPVLVLEGGVESVSESVDSKQERLYDRVVILSEPGWVVIVVSVVGDSGTGGVLPAAGRSVH